MRRILDLLCRILGSQTSLLESNGQFFVCIYCSEAEGCVPATTVFRSDKVPCLLCTTTMSFSFETPPDVAQSPPVVLLFKR